VRFVLRLYDYIAPQVVAELSRAASKVQGCLERCANLVGQGARVHEALAYHIRYILAIHNLQHDFLLHHMLVIKDVLLQTCVIYVSLQY
jgi:hypothetical protein